MSYSSSNEKCMRYCILLRVYVQSKIRNIRNESLKCYQEFEVFMRGYRFIFSVTYT